MPVWMGAAVGPTLAAPTPLSRSLPVVVAEPTHQPTAKPVVKLKAAIKQRSPVSFRVTRLVVLWGTMQLASGGEYVTGGLGTVCDARSSSDFHIREAAFKRDIEQLV